MSATKLSSRPKKLQKVRNPRLIKTEQMGIFKDIKYAITLAKLENTQKLAVIRLWLEIIEADGLQVAMSLRFCQRSSQRNLRLVENCLSKKQ